MKKLNKKSICDFYVKTNELADLFPSAYEAATDYLNKYTEFSDRDVEKCIDAMAAGIDKMIDILYRECVYTIQDGKIVKTKIV